jgi:hypothetical protein
MKKASTTSVAKRASGDILIADFDYICIFISKKPLQA